MRYLHFSSNILKAFSSRKTIIAPADVSFSFKCTGCQVLGSGVLTTTPVLISQWFQLKAKALSDILRKSPFWKCQENKENKKKTFELDTSVPELEA